MKPLHLPFFTLLCALFCHSSVLADPPSDDVLGKFILIHDDAPAAASVVATASPSSTAPRIDAHTQMMSEVVVTAMGYLGKPYVYGKSSLDGGFDCSGFVLSLFQRSLGHDLPRTAAQQARATTSIQKNQLKPGDLVFFNTLRRQFSHVGIYIGEGRFIHSPRAGATIRIESMASAYWQKRFNGARRVSPNPATQVASNSR